jgi:hypothetical protein
MTLNEWKDQIAKEFGTTRYCVVAAASYAARGYGDHRRELGRVTSPFGGRYIVYAHTTIAQERKAEAKG